MTVEHRAPPAATEAVVRWRGAEERVGVVDGWMLFVAWDVAADDRDVKPTISWVAAS
jgi:hypothetical protein